MTEHPVHEPAAQRVDGNAIAGLLEAFGAVDPTLLRIECGGCASGAALAEWVVEADAAAFIVRCPACTHTAATLWRDGGGIDIAGACRIRLASAP